MTVSVWFDEDQRLTKKATFEHPGPSLMDRLRAWLGW
jgi:hypothetical protein